MKTLLKATWITVLALALGCEAKEQAAPAEKAPPVEVPENAEKAQPEETAKAAGDQAETAPEGRFLPADETVDIELKPGETQHFGANFALEDEPIELSEALDRLDELADKPVRIRGVVLGSCAKKGCWMKLQTPEGIDPVRVSFENYGFFVPRSSKGAVAILEGTLQKKVETESARKHYAEDGNASPEEIAKIQGDKVTVRFVATGVDLTLPSI